MLSRIRYLLLAGCSLCLTAQGQEQYAGMGVAANITAGKVLKHTRNFKLPLPDMVTAYELAYVQKTDGRKAWQARHGYPTVGIGITLTDYGMNAIYGRCIGINPNVEFPVIKGSRLEWTMRIGMGFGYMTRHYERFPGWDTINNAIGSRLNNYTIFSSEARYHINDHWDVQIGANFSHVSNASFRRPNLGINTYGAHVGVRYFPVTSRPEKREIDLPRLKNRWLAQARLGIAGVEMSAADGPLYPVYMASLYGSKRYLDKNKAFAGVDYSYHNNVYAFLRNNEILTGKEKANSWKSTVFIGNEFLMGRVGLLLQLGFYLKNTYNSTNIYYEKLGLNFYLLQKEKGILKELYVSSLLKAHGTEAELGEFGLGFGF